MTQTSLFPDARLAAPAWCRGPIAGLDFETTGTDPLTARPVSIALYVDSVDLGFPRLHSLIRCGVPIPADASAVHGITDDRVAVEGRDVAHVIGEALAILEGLATGGIPVVIMNACFDWPLLACEAERIGMRVPDGVLLLDPAVLDRHCDKYRRGSRKLADLAEHYGVTLSDAHDAAADVDAAIAVTRAIARAHPQLQSTDLRALQSMQCNWYEIWKAGINQYWARIGETKRVRGTWPHGERVLAPAV